MSEFYVELQDAEGTAYYADKPIYFDDLEEARMYAKSQLNDRYTLVRVIETTRGCVVDFFGKTIV